MYKNPLKPKIEELYEEGMDCGICHCTLAPDYEKYKEWKKGLIKRKDVNLNIDHIIPKRVFTRFWDQKGKEMCWDKTNLMLTHRTCNEEKGGEYRQKHFKRLQL